MSKILKVNEGDYRIQVPSGNTIILDTGTTSGSVVITGNLDIKGQTTTIESTNATVKDNIIVLNSGEPHTDGSGISLGTAGIKIDRGLNNSTALSAQLLYSESVLHYNLGTNADVSGTFVLSTSAGATDSYAGLKIKAIELDSISSNGTDGITINLKNTNTTVAVTNSSFGGQAYETRLNDNSLTNKKYVTTYVAAGGMTAGMADVDKIYKSVSGVEKAKAIASTTDLQFLINTSLRAKIDTAGLTVDTINIFGTTIKNTGASSLSLTSDINLVELNAVLALDDQSSAPSLTTGKTKIYSSATAGPGNSGLFFTNNITSDELVAKNRALLFSMLF